MRYWWVNQNQTYKFEVPAGFLWSPKTRADGGRNHFYMTMEEVRPGDLVFSYCDTYIKAIGVVQRPAVTAPKPDFRTAGSNWADVGWYAEVEFAELENPIKPKDFMNQIRPLLADKYAPLQENGNGLQGIYLTEISADFGELLILLSQADLPTIQQELAPLAEGESEYEINLEIEARKLIGDPVKIELTKSRRGQGIFKANLRLVEHRCRITGVSNIKHLRASHIKPWAASDNYEKIDGYNGLLLSPHVDHLFDRGFISFKDSGVLLVSKELNPKVLEQWSILGSQNVGEFRAAQCQYLDYHRQVIFQS
jgi:putative restriction endonuclease